MARGERSHASVRRGDRRTGDAHEGDPVDAPVPPPPAADPPHAPPQPEAPQPQGFPGGPEVPSLLRNFKDHEAAYVWREEGRAEMRIIPHGKKIIDYRPPSDRIREALEDLGLLDLLLCCYPNIDRSLIAALVERWHGETCTFHLPVGEMTVTLDDVACLTNLPIEGDLFAPSRLTHQAAVLVVEEELGVTPYEAELMVRGTGVSFERLRALFTSAHASEEAAEAAGQLVDQPDQYRQSEKAYILYLIGCMLMPDKSGDAVPASYLALLHTKERARSTSWGGVMLAHLYDQLSDASLHKTRQCGGFLGLLQAWFYAHFPAIAEFKVMEEWVPRWPLMGRYDVIRTTAGVGSYRSHFDNLTPSQVVWRPYEDWRQDHPRHQMSLYEGLIRFGGRITRHQPSRVTRQYGYVQSIPPEPIRAGTPEEVDEMWAEWAHHLLVTEELIEVPADDPGSCHADYMRWYVRHSHPWMSERAYQEGVQRMMPIQLPHVVPRSSAHDWGRVRDFADRIARASMQHQPVVYDLARLILALSTHHASVQDDDDEEPLQRRVRPRID